MDTRRSVEPFPNIITDGRCHGCIRITTTPKVSGSFRFPLWKADTSLAKFSGLAIIAHRSAETPQVGVKVVNFDEASASLEALDAAFSAKDNALSFNPAKTPVLHLQLLHAEGDTNKPRLQVWARPAGEGVSGTWSALLKDDKSMPLPNPWRLGPILAKLRARRAHRPDHPTSFFVPCGYLGCFACSRSV